MPQPLPPPGSEEVASWLGGVCQLAMVKHDGSEPASFGCACCAPFDGCQPGSVSDAVDDVFVPSTAVSGSFSRAGADERALTMRGCESHAENYGGLLLLERRPEGVVLKRYVSGLNAEDCWAVRRDDGRDVLLCLRGDVHQGTADERLFLWDLSQSDEQLLASEELFSVVDNAWSGCWSPVGTEVSSLQLLPLALSTKAGRLELALELDARRGRVTPAYLARCNALEQAEDAAAARALPSPRTLLRPSRERLHFRFDGSRFVGPSR